MLNPEGPKKPHSSKPKPQAQQQDFASQDAVLPAVSMSISRETHVPMAISFPLAALDAEPGTDQIYCLLRILSSQQAAFSRGLVKETFLALSDSQRAFLPTEIKSEGINWDKFQIEDNREITFDDVPHPVSHNKFRPRIERKLAIVQVDTEESTSTSYLPRAGPEVWSLENAAIIFRNGAAGDWVEINFATRNEEPDYVAARWDLITEIGKKITGIVLEGHLPINIDNIVEHTSINVGPVVLEFQPIEADLNLDPAEYLDRYPAEAMEDVDRFEEDNDEPTAVAVSSEIETGREYGLHRLDGQAIFHLLKLSGFSDLPPNFVAHIVDAVRLGCPLDPEKLFGIGAVVSYNDVQFSQSVRYFQGTLDDDLEFDLVNPNEVREIFSVVIDTPEGWGGMSLVLSGAEPTVEGVANRIEAEVSWSSPDVLSKDAQSSIARIIANSASSS